MANSNLARTAAPALVAVIPPSVVAGLNLATVVEHPVVALILALAYEALLAVLAFVGQVLGLLKTRWAEKVANWVEVTIGIRFSRFDARYRRYVRTGHRLLDQQGLLNVGAFSLDLDEVFVDVSVTPRPPQQVSADPLARPAVDPAERRSIWDLLRPSEAPKVLAVVAGPGCGKSTLLAHMVLQLCGPRLEHRRRRRNLPVLLYLRDHARAIVEQPDLGLPELVRKRISELSQKEPKGWWERQLGDGRCVVMLDGLDEVSKAEDRRAVVAWVTRQITVYEQNDYIVTSRPLGYQNNPLTGADTVQIRNFSPDQVEKFVHRWSLAVELHDADSLANAKRSKRDLREREAAVERMTEANAGKLLDELRKRPELHELSVNPLLLTMVANVHRFKSALPGGRADLYADICEALLWRRHQAKGLSDSLRPEQKEIVARDLAYGMMRDKLRDLGRPLILDRIGKAVKSVTLGVTAADVLAELAAAGLLIEREEGVFAFAHQTLQEYLAAAYIREHGNATILVENVGDPWWRETTLLYVAKSDASAIVRQCLGEGTDVSLRLAFACEKEAVRLNSDARSRLAELLALAATLPKQDPRRRPLVSACIAQNLDQTLPLANGSRICTLPVSNLVYRLFEADMYSYREPRTVGDNDRPAVGMDAIDALSFVEWVNGRSSSTVKYRLPRAKEAKDPVVERLLLDNASTMWHGEGSVFRVEPQVPIGAPDPQRLDKVVVRRELEAELFRTSYDELLSVAALATLTGLALLALRHESISTGRDVISFGVEETVWGLQIKWRSRPVGLRRLLHTGVWGERFDLRARRELAFDLYHGRDREDLGTALSQPFAIAREFGEQGHLLAQLNRLGRRLDSLIRAGADGWPSNRLSLAAMLADLVYVTVLKPERLMLPSVTAQRVQASSVWDTDRVTSAVLREFASSVQPVLTGGKPVTSRSAAEVRAAAMRLGLLCPALDPKIVREVYSLCGNVMHAVTVLQYRADGRITPSEVILLVQD